MTTAAFPYWENRLAPVFDSAKNVCIVTTESGKIVKETRMKLPEDPPVYKAMFLAEHGVETLVCGAISGNLKTFVSSYGVNVTAFRSGELGEIIAAWLNGRLTGDLFAMPGCCGGYGGGRRRRCGNMGNKGELSL